MTARTALLFALLCTFLPLPAEAAERLRVLIIDGQNNHDWKATTPVLVRILERSGRFLVTVTTTPRVAGAKPGAPKTTTPEALAAHAEAVRLWERTHAAEAQSLSAGWAAWRPSFGDFDAVVSNYNGESWPGEVRRKFQEYVHQGGGFVSVHAANNAFPEWPEYNAMIGIGGWGGRDQRSGPYLRLRDGKFVKDPVTPGPGGGHGRQHEFVVETREPSHPILSGLPARWRHAQDELYHLLRGPADRVTVLATSYADRSQNGSGDHEPLLMTLPFGRGRVFHTTLGHSVVAMRGVGFQATLERGVEWVATGAVTLAPPAPGLLQPDTAAVRDP